MESSNDVNDRNPNASPCPDWCDDETHDHGRRKPCTRHTGGAMHMHHGDRMAYQYVSCESNRQHQIADFDETAFVTNGPSDEAQINRMMLAIFDERCPSIRFSAGDVPHYRAAAIAALTALGILTAKAIGTN